MCTSEGVKKLKKESSVTGTGLALLCLVRLSVVTEVRTKVRPQYTVLNYYDSIDFTIKISNNIMNDPTE